MSVDPQRTQEKLSKSPASIVKWLRIPVVLGIGWFMLQILEDVSFQWDMSYEKSNTLSLPMERALMDIVEQGVTVQVIAFESQPTRADARQRDRQLKDLLTQMSRHCTSLHWDMVNLDGDRSLAIELGVQQYGMLVLRFPNGDLILPERQLFQHAMGQNKAVFIGETTLVRALNGFLHPVERTAVAMVGYGEKSLFDSSDTGLSQILNALQNNGFRVRKQDSVQVPTIADDVDLVLWFEPEREGSQAVQQGVIDYLSKGGKVWYASSVDHPHFLNSLQLRYLEGVVAQPEQSLQRWNNPILDLRREALPQMVQEERNVIWTPTPAVEPIPMVDSQNSMEQRLGLTMLSFANISPEGWIERGDPQQMSVSYDEGEDWKGEASLLMGIELSDANPLLQPGAQSRVLVSGDIDWAQNSMLSTYPSNERMLQAILDWFQDDNDAPVVQSNPEIEPLLITKPQLSILRWLLLLPLPVFFMVLGFRVWWVNRE